MIEILSAGALATVQDLGRPGFTDLGIGRSGAADRGAFRLANRLVGNSESAAGVELLFGNLVIRLTEAATIAFTGARCPLTGHSEGSWNAALSCPAGSIVRIGMPQVGLRSYLAVRGGIAIEPVLGSRATDTLSGLGPDVLVAGARLAIGRAVAAEPSSFAGDGAAPQPAGDRPLRLAPGPRAGWFTEQSVAGLFGSSWIVRPDSDRIGTRLRGQAIQPRPGAERDVAELPSEPTLPGAVQVPPDGQPIVLGPDAPVTGGYPVIAVLAAADLDSLAQLRPGAEIRFTPVSTPWGDWPAEPAQGPHQ